MKSYQDRLKAVLDPKERKLLEKLNSPVKIQDFLDTLPINFELKGETYMSPRLVLREKTAHCFEGALLAAAALAYHGHKPLLLDFRAIPEDEDHVITLFRANGLWGAISKTNHSVMRYREPVYASPRELAMSSFHEFFMHDGRKSLRAYSDPFDLSRFKPEDWVTAEEDLIDLVNALDDSRHRSIVPSRYVKKLRKIDKIELTAFESTEWTRRGKKN